jgi:hypothetical protein
MLVLKIKNIYILIFFLNKTIVSSRTGDLNCETTVSTINPTIQGINTEYEFEINTTTVKSQTVGMSSAVRIESR